MSGGTRLRTKVLPVSIAVMVVVIVVAVVDISGSRPVGLTTPPSSTPAAPRGTSPTTTGPAPATETPTTAPEPAAEAPESPVTHPAASSPSPSRRVITSAGAATPASSSSTGQGSASVDYASTAPDPPSADIPADPNLASTCRSPDSGNACIDSTVLAIDNARAQEGIGPMELPTDFGQLTLSEQLFVMVDCERVDRGLTPIAGELASLDQVAAGAAQDQSDPSLPSEGIAGVSVSAWVGNWALTDSVGDALYEWMYDDGLGSINVDCTEADQSGCWIHRDNILGFQNDVDEFGGSLSFGGAVVVTSPAHGLSLESVTMLTTWSPDTATGYYYTWDQAVDDGAA
ncbi:MAG: hypothetical protein ABSC90_04075 [Acidimicrobiales bacterium]